MIHIEMTYPAYLKMRYFVDEVPAEISGFGKVRTKMYELDVVEKGVRTTREVQGLEIYDIEIMAQEVGSGHATMDEETLAMFISDKMRRGESTKDYKVWWHSHNNFEAFFSGTDTTTIAGSTEFPYLISIVTNKAGELKCRIDQFGDLPQSFPNVPLLIQDREDSKLRRFVRQEIDSKVVIASIEPMEPDTTTAYNEDKDDADYGDSWEAEQARREAMEDEEDGDNPLDNNDD